MVTIARNFVACDGWECPLGLDNGSLKVGTLDTDLVTLVCVRIEDVEKEARHMAFRAAKAGARSSHKR